MKFVTSLFMNVRLINMRWSLTSVFSAAEAVPRSSGSIARRVSIKGREDGRKSLNVSEMQRLYGC